MGGVMVEAAGMAMVAEEALVEADRALVEARKWEEVVKEERERRMLDGWRVDREADRWRRKAEVAEEVLRRRLGVEEADNVLELAMAMRLEAEREEL